MDTYRADVAVVGGGGAGLRAAIAVAEAHPELDVALISKVYPMRSHTVAAEGGSAGAVGDDDSLAQHFADTVSGGDWLSDQDVVEYFVEHAPGELARLERWGCPWSRTPDGDVAVRRFGGMSRPRTWFAADKTGFHMLHTLFQTSMKYPQIRRFDEYFAMDLVLASGQVRGVLAYAVRDGLPVFVQAPAVVMATGGAGRVYAQNTNGAIVTGDGMAMAYRAGAGLRDMEFVQYHPTALPGSGVLITEGARGEGGVLTNKDGYRYLQDYGLGPETPVGHPENKHMELGPRDRLSQAFWHEAHDGRTIDSPRGPVVHLDLRHLGAERLHERLPLICELAEHYLGIDPAREPIPVCPTAHYTMGGLGTDVTAATELPGLYAAGECASSGLHGANRLGSNSLSELLVMGRAAGESAAAFAIAHRAEDRTSADESALRGLAAAAFDRYARMPGNGTEDPAAIRAELGQAMSDGVGIYRSAQGMITALETIRELKRRYRDVRVTDTCPVFNTDWLQAIELGGMLDVAEAMTVSALFREESRGSHQRLDGYERRDDEHYLAHSVLHRPADPEGYPEISYTPVTITTSPPGTRAYGAAAQTGGAR